MSDEFVTIFVAGQETTANSLAFTLFEVISNPEIEQKFLEEIDEVIGTKERVEFEHLAQLKYIGQCVMEGLRKFMIVGGTTRLLRRNSFIATFWTNPDVYDPSRFSSPEDITNFRYVFSPFSLGPRNCIGQTFSMFEQKVLLARLIKKFKFRLLPGQTSTINERLTLTLKNLRRSVQIQACDGGVLGTILIAD